MLHYRPYCLEDVCDKCHDPVADVWDNDGQYHWECVGREYSSSIANALVWVADVCSLWQE